MRYGTLLRRLGRDKRAISPAISSTIITAAIIVMLLVVMVFANNYLSSQLANNEFNTMMQFMQTTGLQIDDVAWTTGRAQTIRYASEFGQVNFTSVTLNYYVYAYTSTGTVNFNFSTGILMYRMPTNKYNVANGYRELVFPSSNSSFLQQGTSAPVTQVFVIERVPMNDGNFIRIVVAPSIRMLNSTISYGAGTQTPTNYYNCYLPILQRGSNPYLSQSVTLSTTAVNVQTVQNVNSISITADFPNSNLGFDSSFFNFKATNVQINVPNGSVLEFYSGKVTVSLGLYS
jgi:hypothetical protein